MTESHRPIMEIARQYGYAVYREATVTAAGMADLTLAYDHKQADLLSELAAAVEALTAPVAPVLDKPLPIVLKPAQRKAAMRAADHYGKQRWERGFQVGSYGNPTQSDMEARADLARLLAKPLSDW